MIKKIKIYFSSFFFLIHSLILLFNSVAAITRKLILERISIYISFNETTFSHIDLIIQYLSLMKGTNNLKHIKTRYKPGIKSSSVNRCLLNGSVWELSKCRMMIGRSMMEPPGSSTGSCIKVSISGSKEGGWGLGWVHYSGVRSPLRV